MLISRKQYLWLICLFALFYIAASCDSNKKDCQPSITTVTHKPSTPLTGVTMPKSNQCMPTKPKGEPEPKIIGAGVLLMLGGVYLSTLGFAFFRPTMFIFGCFIGSFLVWVSLQYSEPVEVYSNCYNLYLGSCLGCGVVLGIAFMFFYPPVIFLIGVSAGALFVTWVISWDLPHFVSIGYYMRWVFFAVVILFFFIFTLYFEFVTILFSLSFIGGYAFMLGLDMMIMKGFHAGFEIIWDFNQEHNKNSEYKLNLIKRFVPGEYKIDVPVYTFLGSIIGWILIFTCWQMWFNKGNRFGVRIIRNSNDTLAKIK